MTDVEEIYLTPLDRIEFALRETGLCYCVQTTEKLFNRRVGASMNHYAHKRITKIRIECDQLAVIFRNHPMGVEIKPYASGDRSWNLWRLDPTKEEIINWSNWSLTVPK